MKKKGKELGGIDFERLRINFLFLKKSCHPRVRTRSQTMTFVFMDRILWVLSCSEKHVVWFGLGLLTATPRFRLVG